MLTNHLLILFHFLHFLVISLFFLGASCSGTFIEYTRGIDNSQMRPSPFIGSQLEVLGQTSSAESFMNIRIKLHIWRLRLSFGTLQNLSIISKVFGDQFELVSASRLMMVVPHVDDIVSNLDTFTIFLGFKLYLGVRLFY